MSQLIVCLDFDGTLVDRDNRIHPDDIALLADPGEVLFIPATGRPLHAVRRSFDLSGLFSHREIPLPMVLQNGSVNLFAGEQIGTFYPIPLATQSALIDIVMAMDGFSMFCFAFDSVEVIRPNALTDLRVSHFGLSAHPFNPSHCHPRYAKLMGVAYEQEPLQAFSEAIGDFGLEVAFSMPTVLEVTLSGINKGRGLMDIITGMDITDPRVFAIGDGDNDRPMFELADRIFVPSGSPAPIQALADVILERDKGLLLPILKAAGVK